MSTLPDRSYCALVTSSEQVRQACLSRVDELRARDWAPAVAPPVDAAHAVSWLTVVLAVVCVLLVVCVLVLLGRLARPSGAHEDPQDGPDRPAADRGAW